MNVPARGSVVRLNLVIGMVLATIVAGFAFAQAPQPAPTPAVPSDTLPVPPAPAPAVAKSWVLMDYATGQVLAGENIDLPVEPASITKVMTSYVVAAEMKGGKIKPTDPVMMSEHAWRSGGAGTDGSYSGFEVNKTAPLSAMEKGMVVQSGNDAAIALAEHIAGSEQAFAALMNAYAKRIGMNNTHFVNPHGLPADGHLSTARDLALLGRALVRDFPEAYAHNKIKEFTVGPITQRNRNVLLWRDPSVDGIKTGHTSAAGYCLMASAKRGDQRLISVVMGTQREPARGGSQVLLTGASSSRPTSCTTPARRSSRRRSGRARPTQCSWGWPRRCWSACSAASTRNSSRRWTCPGPWSRRSGKARRSARSRSPWMAR